MATRTDTSAARGISSSQGFGTLRYLDTHMLWVQEAVRSMRVELKKVLGDAIPVDVLAKCSISKERFEKLVELHDLAADAGRRCHTTGLRTASWTLFTAASRRRKALGLATSRAWRARASNPPAWSSGRASCATWRLPGGRGALGQRRQRAKEQRRQRWKEREHAEQRRRSTQEQLSWFLWRRNATIVIALPKNGKIQFPRVSTLVESLGNHFF